MKNLFTVLSIILSLNSFAQIPNYVPTNGLVGWYPFNGNANDESPNGNNGTVTSATLTTDRFSTANSAYSFNGNSNIQTLIPTANAPSASNFYSVSMWFNKGSNSQSIILQYIAGNGSSNISNYDIFNSHSLCNPATIAVQNYPFNNPSACSPYTVNIGIWTNLYIVFDQVIDSFKVYKNGEYWFNGQISNNSPTSGYLMFGNNFTGAFGFNGKIDDIGVWNRALTSNEIKGLYNGGLCFQYVTVTDTLIINANLTSINPITYSNTIKVYPNPTNDHITIDYGNYASLNGYTLKIMNSLSQIVFTTAITQQQSFVDLSTWNGNGIYFVHLIDGQGNTIDIRKIVLQ